jgi:protoporphyrinogen oxidase
MTAPGAVSSRLLRIVDAELASMIGRIPHAGCSVAVLGVRRDQIKHPLDGFGFVVPAIENRRIIAGSMASVKFPGRAPEGKVLLRVFVGGALQPELGDLPDADIQRLVCKELAELIGLSGEPELCNVVRWQGMMPQYHVGHLDLVAKIEQRAAAIHTSLLPAMPIAGGNSVLYSQRRDGSRKDLLAEFGKYDRKIGIQISCRSFSCHLLFGGLGNGNSQRRRRSAVACCAMCSQVAS